MSALKCNKLLATTFLEIFNANFGPRTPVLRRLERVFASRGDWFQVNAIPITMPREIERAGNESCKFTINLS